jgi:hypothetical protein
MPDQFIPISIFTRSCSLKSYVSLVQFLIPSSHTYDYLLHIQSSTFHTILLLFVFEKYGIQENGCADQHRLLFHRRCLGKVDFKCVGVGKDFRGDGLGCLDNLAQLRGITAIRVGDGSIKNPKRHLAAAERMHWLV